MWQLLQIEVYKIFKRPRTYIAFAVIAFIILLIQVALKFGGEEYVGFLMSGVNESFEVPTKQILNGYLVCYIILNLLLIHVPILVALIAGDMISGEANMGTLRLLASKPVSRTRLLLIKFTAASLYTFLLLIWVALLSLLLSILLFGTNDLFVARELDSNIIAGSDVLWRYIAAFGFAAIGLITVTSLAFMLSTFADNSIGPVVATVCVIIVFTILTQMQIPLYDETIKPYLFTTHMLGWKGFFYVKGQEGETIKGSIENLPAVIRRGLVLIGYAVGFLFILIWQFRKKDIFSLKKVYGIYFIPKGSVNINLNNIFLNTYGFDIIDVGKEKVTNLRIIKLLPKDENTDVVLSTLYNNEVQSLIKKSKTTTKDNGTYELEMIYGKHSDYGLADKVIFSFNTKDYKLPKGVTFDYDDGNKKEQTPDKLKNKKGKVEISYSNYAINKGVPDSVFQ